MSQPAKVGLALLAAVVGVFIVLKVVGLIVSTLLGFIIPLAILGGIGLVVYGLVTRNSLPGGRRYLP
ncbi:MAG TPA: hypothetical protein VG820_00755 [Fimbriimonadaceae bacterium]|nr:hypothetical protein [Fimbriimonadaceae bacterium]